jgi:hypothetical protein
VVVLVVVLLVVPGTPYSGSPMVPSSVPVISVVLPVSAVVSGSVDGTP